MEHDTSANSSNLVTFLDDCLVVVVVSVEVKFSFINYLLLLFISPIS